MSVFRYNRSITAVVSLVAVIFAMLCGNAIAAGEEYILQPGDVISINVVEHPEFSVRNKIRPDGRINFPVIGEVDVASLSCAQLVKIMQGKLSPYVNNPVVSIAIESYYSNKIFALGDVNRPGEFEIFEPTDIVKAIAICGGTKNPRAKVIKIIRGDGTVISVDARNLWSGQLSKRDLEKYLLYPGDTMYVPESSQINWGLITTVLSVIMISIQIVYYAGIISSK